MEYDMDKHDTDWITGGPLYNTFIFKNVHGRVFEEFIRDAITDRYNLMCSIDAHEKKNHSEYDDGISGGGYPITLNSIREALVSLSATIGLIGCCLQGLEHNFLERCNMFFLL